MTQADNSDRVQRSVKRRGRGEGAIFKRRDGSWCAAITAGYGQDGKRRRKYVYAKTKRQVQEKLMRLQAGALDGFIESNGRLKVGEFLHDLWLDSVIRPKSRPSTCRLYETTIKKHIGPWIGGIQLCKLTPVHVQNLYATLERERRSPRLREMVHARLHCALRHALRMGMISRNPCEVVDRPRAASKTMRVLDGRQAKLFLGFAKNDRLYALYLLAVTTGLRQGELLGLQWAEVNFDQRTLSVQHSLAENAGKFYLETPKTKKGRRLVELTSQAVEALREHRKSMIREGNSGPWVFCDSEGGPLRKSNLIRRSFKPLLRNAGLPSIRFHDLRHTAATLLFAQGAHPKVVQELLGHAKIGLTLDLYSHSVPTLQRETVDRMETFLAALEA